MALVSLSVITLNVNSLNSPVKWHSVTGWIKKQDPTTSCLQETNFSFKDTHRLKMKR